VVVDERHLLQVPHITRSITVQQVCHMTCQVMVT
jgi:hypothetical protein